MATDVLGFATSGSKKSPKPVASSTGTQKDITAIQKRAAPQLSDTIGQGADQSYQNFIAKRVTTQKQAAQAKQPVKAPPKSLFNKVRSFVGDNVVKPTVTTVDKSVNTVAAGAEGAAGASKAIVQKAVGNDKAAAKTVQTTSRVINDKLTKGAGGKGAYLTPKQAQKGGSSLIKPAAQAVTDIAPLVVPVGNVAKGASLGVRVARGATDNALLGATTDTANQVIQHKGLNKGEIVKSAVVGGLIGGLVPGAHEGTKVGANSLKDAASTTASKDLIKNQKTRTLLDAAHDTPEVKTTYNPSNPQVKTIIEARQKQAEAIEAPAKAAEAEQKANIAEAEKTQEQSKKVDRQIELIKAKGKDSETGLSNVDKTKLTHLQEDKQQLQAETATSGTVADVKPPQQSPATVEAPQTPAPTVASEKPVSASSGNSTPKEAAVAMSSKTKVSVDPNAPPERGVSKVAQSIQTKAVARGLKDTFGEAAGYDKINIDNMSEKATAITNDPERLNRIISGEEKLPNDVRPTSLVLAIEKHPTLSKDPDIINRLSQAEHLAGESSRSAQEMRLARERNPNSPTEAMRQVRKARVAAIERKSGTTLNKAVITEVKAAVAEKPKVTKETWGSFVESLRC
jgi:hypothetical protein